MNFAVLSLGGAVVLAIVSWALFLAKPDRIRAYALGSVIIALTLAGNDTAPKAVWQPVFLGSIALLILALVRTHSIRSRPGWLFTALVAWWLLVTAGVLIGASFSLGRAGLYFTLALLAAYVVTQLTPPERTVLYRFVIIAALAQIVSGAVELTVLSEPVWGYRGGSRSNPFLGDTVFRVQGTMGHPIPFALLQSIAIVMVWANAIRVRQVVRVPLLALLSYGLLISGTRSAVLATIIAILVHLMLSGSLSRLARAAAAIATGVLLLLIVPSGLSDLITELVSSGSWTHRLGALQSIPDLLSRPLRESVFGNGFGSEVQLYEHGIMRQRYLQVVDDMWVYALGTMGLVGLVALVVLVVAAFVRADRLGKTVLTVFIAMFFSFDVLVWMPAGILFSLLLVMPVSPRVQRIVARPVQHEEARQSSRPLPARPTLVSKGRHAAPNTTDHDHFSST